MIIPWIKDADAIFICDLPCRACTLIAAINSELLIVRKQALEDLMLEFPFVRPTFEARVVTWRRGEVLFVVRHGVEQCGVKEGSESRSDAYNSNY